MTIYHIHYGWKVEGVSYSDVGFLSYPSKWKWRKEDPLTGCIVYYSSEVWSREQCCNYRGEPLNV